MRRFFVPLDSVRGGRCVIEGSDARHLALTLRASPGYEFEATDGRSGRLKLEVLTATPSRVECRIVGSVPAEERSVSVTLYQAVPRQFKMDDVVRTACELGVTRLVPLASERSMPHYDAKTLESKAGRWSRVAMETMKRVGRTTVMQILPLVKPEEIARHLVPGSLRIVPWELEEDATLKSVLRGNAGAKEVEIVIGAEGGFGTGEIGTFRTMGFAAVTLGRRVLTVETAVLTTLACVYYELD